MRTPVQFEECMSLLTASLGSLERLQGLSEDQINRFRQFVIRASNAERKMRRE